MPNPAATWISGRPLDASNETASRLKSSVNERRVLFVIITPRSLRSLYEVSTKSGEGHKLFGNGALLGTGSPGLQLKYQVRHVPFSVSRSGARPAVWLLPPPRDGLLKRRSHLPAY